jgi:tyrosyl-tRNA synthetase
MGKTEKGAVFLDPSMCSPYDFFQYWRNVPDNDVEKFLLLYTFLPTKECWRLGNMKGQAINEAKEVLAYELTKIVHGTEESNRSREAARAAFSSGGDDLSGIPSIKMTSSEIAAGINVMDLFARTSLCSSKGEARRLVTQGGARINDRKIGDIDAMIDSSFVEDGELLLRAGKKRYFRVIVTG